MAIDLNYDVIVCGGGTSGVISAISCSRNGCKVLIVEKTALLGGTNVLSIVGPFMSYHYKDKQIINGIAQEIILRLKQNNKSLGHIEDPLGFASTVTPVDLEGLKSLYFEMIVEEGIDCLFHSFIHDVIKDKDKVIGVKAYTKSKEVNIYGKVIIDATGDGDVCMLAGCDYFVGRASDNLSQPMSMLLTLGNVNIEKVKEYMKQNPSEFVLRDDYNFEYVGVSGFYKQVKEATKNSEFGLNRDRVLFFQDVNKNEVTINMTRVQKYSSINALELSKAEIEGRMQLIKAYKFMKKYVLGFEDSYIVRTPEQIGVRESRHIKTQKIMEYSDLASEKTFEDSIAVGAFPMDIHSPDKNNLEGTTIVQNVCYEIPMGVIKPIGVNNLLVVGRCVGATHEASASMRLSPICMALGQASGVLSSIAINQNITTNEVCYQDVQDILTKDNQIFKK